MEQSVIKNKIAMNGDIVVPRLIIDSGVLFDPGSFDLKPKAAEEFIRVAEFVRLFTPGKLIVEGHTDSDGGSASNLRLSEQRAQQITKYLVDQYDYITPAMVEARGFGESRSLVPNDTPENKALNRRIEVIVWE
jgi:outer membrane protein OmpA-like peptidoglycan-associated protein